MIYSKNNFNIEFLKNVLLTSKIDLFSNYLKNPEDVDVNQITHLLFDTDVKFDTNNNGTPDKINVQFKEIIGVGFSYKLLEKTLLI